MDSVFGFKGKDFVCLVADTVFKHSILVLKECADRTVKIHEGQGMIVTGEDGDVLQFTDYIKHSLKLRSFVKATRQQLSHQPTLFAQSLHGPFVRARTTYVITGAWMQLALNCITWTIWARWEKTTSVSRGILCTSC